MFAVVSSGSRQVLTGRLTSLYEMNGGRDEGLEEGSLSLADSTEEF